MESITNQEIEQPFTSTLTASRTLSLAKYTESLMTQSLSTQLDVCFTAALRRCARLRRAGVFSHRRATRARSCVFRTDSFLQVSGGWHDAGDYGRYVVPACKAVADLLLAFRAAPELSATTGTFPKAEMAWRTSWTKFV
jgi:hypothetical protein